MRFERRGFSVFASGREMRRAGYVHTYVKRERKKKQMNKITRKGFLKIAAAAAMSGVTAGALAACESAGSTPRSTTTTGTRTSSASTPSAARPRPATAAPTMCCPRWSKPRLQAVSSAPTPSRSWPTSWASPARTRTTSWPPSSATTSCTTPRRTPTSASRPTA